MRKLILTATLIALLAALAIAACMPTTADAMTHRQWVHWKAIRREARLAGLPKSERQALKVIARRESGFNPHARNGLYKGVFQLACGWRNGHLHRAWLYRDRRWSSVRHNLRAANKYVRNRYGSWKRAKRHSDLHGWY